MGVGVRVGRGGRLVWGMGVGWRVGSMGWEYKADGLRLGLGCVGPIIYTKIQFFSIISNQISML